MDDLREKIGILTAKVDAAHSRVDKLDTMVAETLKEVQRELKDLTAHMNKGKGWAAALFFLAGSTGAGVVKLLSMVGK